MTNKKYEFSFEEIDSIDALSEGDAVLLERARKLTANSYAPYSRFRVGAVAMLVNGQIIEGTNQENASYPVGLCAERALMAAAATVYPEVPIGTMAISYDNQADKSQHPISPCGMCRQALHEFEERTHHPIRLILSGQSGKIFIIDKAGMLLPLAFSSKELLK